MLQGIKLHELLAHASRTFSRNDDKQAGNSLHAF
jgi:hypothetical protein